MFDNEQENEDDFDFDLDNGNLDAFDGVSVEGGFDPDADEDEGCAGGACKI